MQRHVLFCKQVGIVSQGKREYFILPHEQYSKKETYSVPHRIKSSKGEICSPRQIDLEKKNAE